MGLYERDYMSGGNSGRSDMKYLWALIAINSVVYIITSSDPAIEVLLSVHCPPNWLLPVQLVSAGFVHAGFSHILFNMWGLFIFGRLVVPHLGGRNFILLYLIGVVSGNVLFLIFNLLNARMLCGASGAVYAIMMGAAMLEPDRRFMMLYLPFWPIKTTTLVICYTVIETVLLFHGSTDIAHLAHLGGFLGGYILVKFLMRDNLAWDPFRRRGAGKISWKMPKDSAFSSSGGTVSRDELDALLDKISREGINSLTPEELERLKRAREEMRR